MHDYDYTPFSLSQDQQHNRARCSQKQTISRLQQEADIREAEASEEKPRSKEAHCS